MSDDGDREPATGTGLEGRAERDGATPAGPGVGAGAGARARFPVIGVGASAGGLAAIEELLQGLPDHLGAAFVVVQHLDPRHESHLVPLLSGSTTMEVRQAEDGMPVLRDCVYVIPPNASLAIVGGRLRLGAREPDSGQRMPIDAFLRSLAEDQEELAGAVILSGTGSDGAAGVRAVQAAGGFVVVQDPATAEHDGMPRSAVATGSVDHVAPVGQIPRLLAEYLSHPLAGTTADAETAGRDHVSAVLALLLAKTQSDFRRYKKPTIVRRVERRMGVRRAATWPDYLELLRTDPDEASLLAKDLLIRVTSFFREPEAFEALRTQAIEPLLQEKSPGVPIRVWIPGCATGEEAYSVAILLAEELARSGQTRRIAVFATDLDESALDVARQGLYPSSIETDVSAERLARFFAKEGDHYRIDKQLRELVVFAVQNVISDPAFSHVDLVSCRNVLIYLEPEVQKRVFSLFDFALGPGGFLFLGKSDGAGGPSDVFVPVSKKWRIFRHARSGPFSALALPTSAGARTGWAPAAEPRRKATRDLGHAAQAAALDELSASVVVVDRAGRVLYLQGPMARYMDLPTGDPDLNLLSLARGKLAGRLRGALRRVVASRETVRLRAVPVPGERSARHVDVTLRPLPAREGADAGFVVVLREATAPSEWTATEAAGPFDRDAVVEQLESEVRSGRDELRTAVEEFETSNEELKAANEEVMSMNEELQSTNEELETSKEELQSLNEELATVNAQIQQQLDELNLVNDDLANFLAATDIATVFLDTHLRVKRFTPSATGLLNLIATDVGRPIGHLSHGFEGLDLSADADIVLRDLRPLEKEVVARDGSWYTVRILLYRTHAKQVDGVVITFSDVTRLKRADDASIAARRYAESIVETIREPLLVLDASRRVVSANGAFLRTFGGRLDEIDGRTLTGLGGGQWDTAALSAVVDQLVSRSEPGAGLEVAIEVPERGRRLLVVSASRVVASAGASEPLTLLLFEDVTEQRQYEGRLRTLNDDLERRVIERSALSDQRATQLRALTAEMIHAERSERQRLAKLLHDHLQQLLVAAKLQLGTWRKSAHDEALDSSAGQVQELLDECIKESRALAVDLSPPVLREAGLVDGLGWLVRTKEAQHGLQVALVVAPGEDVEPADPDVKVFLFEAVRELLFNVVKHSGLRAATVRVTRASGDVEIRVEDEGRGFDAGSSRVATDCATGLGMFAIGERARFLGGAMSVDTAPGRGTRVTLRAPAGRWPEQAKPTAEVRRDAAVEVRATSSGAGAIRVLLADDHELLRRGLAALLAVETGIQVVGEASDGAEAVELARSLCPDVIVMDVSMPRMDGVQATRQIHDEYPGIRIVGLSMHDQDEMADAMRSAGAAGFVTKGAAPEVLVSTIRCAFARRTAG